MHVILCEINIHVFERNQKCLFHEHLFTYITYHISITNVIEQA